MHLISKMNLKDAFNSLSSEIWMIRTGLIDTTPPTPPERSGERCAHLLLLRFPIPASLTIRIIPSRPVCTEQEGQLRNSFRFSCELGI
ncbi:hypothetical protein JTE90_007201 [Oedothorax gibbosus]|uniref:Uncharacterized protein n=1 Tax=Oedothorax gibbosus TaxID=931172 RepID=A0AAV6UF05_9ARAC|nr:hypothetical protein JTE90_007201 [Oedothorax gibbosus]